jgi:hypothetical protein
MRCRPWFARTICEHDANGRLIGIDDPNWVDPSPRSDVLLTTGEEIRG